VIANYRKHHLYTTDETWAEEGRDGFFASDVSALGRVAMGICMFPFSFSPTAPTMRTYPTRIVNTKTLGRSATTASLLSLRVLVS
jgi:hypothetical protein